jgi:hypothetical protein
LQSAYDGKGGDQARNDTYDCFQANQVYAHSGIDSGVDGLIIYDNGHKGENMGVTMGSINNLWPARQITLSCHSIHKFHTVNS